MNDIFREMLRLLQNEIREVNDRPRKLSCHSAIMLCTLAITELCGKAILSHEDEDHRSKLRRVMDQCDLVLMGIDIKRYTNRSINELIRKVDDLKQNFQSLDSLG